MSCKGLVDLGWFIFCDIIMFCVQVILQFGCFNCVNNFDVVFDGIGIFWFFSRNLVVEIVRVIIEEWLMSERFYSLLNFFQMRLWEEYFIRCIVECIILGY